MGSALQDLSQAISAKDEQRIIDNLTKLSSQDTEDIELENSDIPKSIITLNNNKITKPFVELAAELCKNEKNRKAFTDKDIIEYLFKLLDRKDEYLTVSTIRVLGNICYENEEARRIIDKNHLATVLSILERDSERKNNSLTLKVSGFLVNLLMNNEELAKSALSLQILDKIETVLLRYMKSFKENQMLFAFLLNVLNNVVDYIDDQNIAFTEHLCITVVGILKLSSTPEISVSCLEILHGQSEKDEIKSILAKNGVCELVFGLIEKYMEEVNDEESRSVLKMACDMIVIITTGDECMNLLYNNGKGKAYENMLTWLDSDDGDLLSTGVLAVGNFARKDSHCIQLVQNGISKRLISILSKYNKPGSDIKVQHALLSTLKNLVIPQPNKEKILNEGLIDVIYPMIHIEQYLVIFKLLGTFRMVIDGQEKTAFYLISQKEFLEKLVNWCYNSDHLGVRGEIPRLLSWLIKNCHSFKPFKNVIGVKNAVKCLVEMISSNHAVMQNEAFYALSLLCIGCSTPDKDGKVNGVTSSNEDAQLLFQQLVDADIGKNLTFVINKYSEKMDKHTIENLLTLLNQLIDSSMVVSNLRSSNITDALCKLATNPNAQTERFNKILAQIKN